MNELLLLTHLAFAVPFRIDELRDQPDWALEEIRAGLPERLQQRADVAMFGGGRPGEARQYVGALTTALALMALQADGGVDFAGLHWCAIPHCRASSRYDHGDDLGPDPWAGIPELPEPDPAPTP
jgi:hypothetical protein